MVVNKWGRRAVLAAIVVASFGLHGCSSHDTHAVPAVAASTHPTAVPDAGQPSIIGSWQVKVTGAPYSPHLFAFLPGGVMISTNPSGVQATGADGTTDSIGLGTWQVTHGTGVPGVASFVGSFVELNASSRTRKPAPALQVTWRITIIGDTLTGTAVAGLAGDKATRPASFQGTRIKTDVSRVASVS